MPYGHPSKYYPWFWLLDFSKLTIHPLCPHCCLMLVLENPIIPLVKKQSLLVTYPLMVKICTMQACPRREGSFVKFREISFLMSR